MKRGQLFTAALQYCGKSLLEHLDYIPETINNAVKAVAGTLNVLDDCEDVLVT